MYVKKTRGGLSFTPSKLEGKERSRLSRKTAGICIVEAVVCTVGKNIVQCKKYLNGQRQGIELSPLLCHPIAM